jgi:hypothetical protein
MQSNSYWFDGTRQEAQVRASVNCAQEASTTKFKFNKNKKFNSETLKKVRAKCLFCGNLGYEESQCRFKQKASAETQKKRLNSSLKLRKTMPLTLTTFLMSLSAWMSSRKSRSSWATWTWR